MLKPSLFQVDSLIHPLSLPEFVIPFPVLLAGDLPVSGRGIEALVAEVLLEETEAITGIIMLHGIYGKSVPELMRGDVVDFARFGINEFWQAGFFSALLDDLPGAVAVNTKYHLPAVFLHRATAIDVFLEH